MVKSASIAYLHEVLAQLLGPGGETLVGMDWMQVRLDEWDCIPGIAGKVCFVTLDIFGSTEVNACKSHCFKSQP